MPPQPPPFLDYDAEFVRNDQHRIAERQARFEKFQRRSATRTVRNGILNQYASERIGNGQGTGSIRANEVALDDGVLDKLAGIGTRRFEFADD
jgi:hypothetical protein